MTKRPSLTQALIDILLNGDLPISEYQLINLLQQEPYQLFEPAALREPLTLFQCHFVLFHHLYQLQDRFMQEQQKFLHIHATAIYFESIKQSDDDLGLVQSDRLREYYLDWSNFDTTDKHDVEQLLDSFWQKMGPAPSVTSEQDKQRALDILDLDNQASLSQVKKRYRQLQHRYHPDKGGHTEQSQNIDWAYSVLKACSVD